MPKPESPKPETRSLPDWLTQLGSASYHQRCEAQRALERQGAKAAAALREALAKGQLGPLARLHGIWVLARVEEERAIPALLDVAQRDAEPRVRAQAVRAMADLADPVLVKHRLDAKAGDAELARRLAALAKDQAPQVVREVIIAVGRLRWPDAPAWLRETLKTSEPAASHAALQALRQSGNWPAVLALLDEADSLPIRAAALRAISHRHEAVLADGLIERLRREQAASRRREYADLLTRIHNRPGPWTYWGYRPPPRPANTVSWERTAAIGQALDRALADSDRDVRLAVLRRMQREKVPTRVATLGQWLREERHAERVGVLLETLRSHPATETRDALIYSVTQRDHTVANRLAALTQLLSGLDAANQAKLAELAGSLEDGPVLAAALAALAQRPGLKPSPLLLDKLGSADAGVRAAAIEALGALRAGGRREDHSVAR